MNPLTPLAASAATAAANRSEDLARAAQGFEAIFVRQMLSAARQASFGEDGLFSGEGMQAFRQMQDERFADIAASRGAFGLAKMIEAQLGAQSSTRPREASD